MKRSFTADHPFIKYEAASATLTFDATTPPAPGLEVFDTRFQFGPNAAFDSFLHFHIDHAEFLYCERGRIRVTIDHETRIVGPEDGEISIPKWVPHRWETLQIDEETVVWERTDPADGEKELFFRNFMSLFNDYGGAPPVLQVFKIFADYDNYPMGPGSWMLAFRKPIVYLTYVAGRIATAVGYRSRYKEYTPTRLIS